MAYVIPINEYYRNHIFPIYFLQQIAKPRICAHLIDESHFEWLTEQIQKHFNITIKEIV